MNGKQTKRKRYDRSKNCDKSIIMGSVSSSCNKKKRRKLSMKKKVKRTLSSVKKAEPYQIPKDIFNQTLLMLEKEPQGSVQTWETSCQIPIHMHGDRKHETRKISNNRLLIEARSCLLNRDWTNLSLILTMFNPKTKQEYYHYSPVFFKYALLCLYSSKDPNRLARMEIFLESVLGLQAESERKQYLKNIFYLYESSYLDDDESYHDDDEVVDKPESDRRVLRPRPPLRRSLES